MASTATETVNRMFAARTEAELETALEEAAEFTRTADDEEAEYVLEAGEMVAMRLQAVRISSG